MSDITPILGLIRQYLQDHGDKRVDNINWDIIDGLFHAIDGHKHDGVDSPLIDLDALWRAIFELRAICAQLRIDLTNLDIREWMHYQEYIKHKHYALDTPPSIETHWFETFQDYNQTDLINTSAAVSVASSALHLPLDYIPNEPYIFASKPFPLAHTLVDNPNPDVQPDQAYARIVMTRQGIVTPYIAIGDTLTADNDNPRIYPGARAGIQQEVSFIDQYIKHKISLENKRNNDMSIPHMAWHHHHVQRPQMTHFDKREKGRKKRHPKNIKREDGPRGFDRIWGVDLYGYTDRIEFFSDEYNSASRADNREVSTVAGFNGITPTADYANLPQGFRILYDHDRPLAWQKEGQKFFWYDSSTKTAEEIPKESIPLFYEDRMVDVAAIFDPSDNSIWVLKSWVKKLNKPDGFFQLHHQMIKWDGGEEFIEGNVWKQKRMKRKHWPTWLMVPSRLRVDKSNIYPVTHFDYNELRDEGEVLVNYYDGDDVDADAHDDYQWFPFKKLYGNLHKKRKTVSFVPFNPGILGSVHKIPKSGEWVATGTANIIKGVYDPTANAWSTMEDEDINAFEGGNDNVYLGSVGDEILYYQSFIPYDGADILTNERYKDKTWRDAHPDYAWNGIVAHNLVTGENRYVKGNIPMKVNTGGAISPEGGEAYLYGGVELVKQFYTSDGRLIATKDNSDPVGTNVVYAFWVDRNLPGAVTVDRITMQEEIDNPVKVNLSTGNSEKIVTSVLNTSPDDALRVHNPQVVMHSNGFSQVGGRVIEDRLATRVRTRHRAIKKIKKWYGAISDGAKARQVFLFDLGDNVTSGDIIKLYTKARSEGRISTDIAGGSINDVEVYGFVTPEWRRIGGMANENGLTVFDIKDEDMVNTGEIVIMLESSRVSDKSAEVTSFLHTDHIYLTIQKQNYVYEYKWEDLPDGKNAVIVLECTGGSDPAGNLVDGDFAGVRVDSAEISIVANREG